MKKIKVKFCNDDVTFIYSYAGFILAILKKYYEVEISEEPDYIFYSDTGYDHINYDGIKIYYTGENVSPNFNICDYAFGFDHLTFEDRYYRFPLYLAAVFYNPDELLLAGDDYLHTQQIFTKEKLLEKKEFCSFVYSNYRAETERKKIFTLLSTYKKVSGAGSYLNNNGGKKIKNKLEFEKKHKFSIAFENSSRSGYTTEKLVSSLVAETIPIYWGNPNIGKEFNTKRFINCHEYESFDQVIDRVKELDSDDELYIKMLNEPYNVEGFNYDDVRNGLETFLRSIIDQPIEKAKRSTINPVIALSIKNATKLTIHVTKWKSALIKIGSLLYKPFKHSQFFEGIKHSYFSKEK